MGMGRFLRTERQGSRVRAFAVGFARWMASVVYFVISAAHHKGYFDYLPSGAQAWVESRITSRTGDVRNE